MQHCNIGKVITSPPVDGEEVSLEAEREDALRYRATAEHDEDQRARTLRQELPHGGAGHSPRPAAGPALLLDVVHPDRETRLVQLALPGPASHSLPPAASHYRG